METLEGQSTISPLPFSVIFSMCSNKCLKCPLHFLLFLLSASFGAGLSHAASGRDISTTRTPTNYPCGYHR